jgi:hypothetical protein
MSELDKTFQETIFNTLASLLAQNKFDTDTQLDIYLAMKQAALDMQEAKVEKIRSRIAEWESIYVWTSRYQSLHIRTSPCSRHHKQ